MQTIKIEIKDTLAQALKNQGFDLNKLINNYLDSLISQDKDILEDSDFLGKQKEIAQKIEYYHQGTLQTKTHKEVWGEIKSHSKQHSGN